MSKNAIFDGYDFEANDVKIHTLDMYSRTPKSIQLEARAIEDGLVQVSSRYSGKPITIEGKVQRDTSDELEEAIDDFLLAISGDLRILDIPHAGSTRRFVATAQAPIISRARGGASMVEYSVEFIVPEGYGSDTDTLELLNTTVTDEQADLAITVGGSYKAQPDITVTVVDVTDGDPQKSISITNPATTEGITVTRNWAIGDVLIFNARDRIVYLNNNQIYASGAFPSWTPGSQVLTYTDDFTDREVDILATYTRRWL